MTVPAKIPADTHVGNGVTTQFAYSFLCFDKVDFKVFIDLVLVDPSEYTVDGLGNPSGGMVTFTTPPANGVSVILRLDVVLDRQTNYQYEGDFLSPVVNRDFDRLWLSQQSQQVDLNAAVRFPPGESVSFLPAVNTRKGKALVFNEATGEPEPSVDDYNDQAANAAASAAAADQAKQDAQTAAGNSSDAADAAAQSATDAANAAASVDPQGLSTDHYGPTAPSTTWPGMTWADSGTNTLWRRNAADDDWVNEGTIFKRALPEYAIGDVPTVDKGPIYGIGAGPMEWGGTQYEGVTAAIQGSHKNLKGSAAGTDAHVAFSADQVVVEAANGTFKTLRAVGLDIDSATVGANGLDTGALAASTWYSVWVIWDGTATAGLLSLSETTPTLPAGYTHKARVGWIRTDATANKHPLAFRQAGQKVRYTLTSTGNSMTTPKLSSGAKGAPTTPTYAAIGVTGFVPPTAVSIAVTISNASNNPELSILAPNPNYGSPGSTTAPAFGLTSYGYGNQEMSVSLETQNIYYATVGSALYCVGWEDLL
ncbi:hypothetical protein ABRZ04_05180 [Castellaniella ginsengisoli]|uniref:Uncharacterized protein n=1 Tax=Castellaniella ginsengisoli TaxID=546114 RepID=A0AB39D3A1_9BURK